MALEAKTVKRYALTEYKFKLLLLSGQSCLLQFFSRKRSVLLLTVSVFPRGLCAGPSCYQIYVSIGKLQKDEI